MSKLDPLRSCARTSAVRSILLLLAAADVGCTVLNNLDGYAGGARDIGDTSTTVVVDSDAPDTFVPVDTAMPDTFVEETAAETPGDSTTDVSDTADSATMETTVTDSDAGPCGVAFVDFGLSEFQVRGTFGMGDKREWVELTNYGSTALDVSNVSVKIFSGMEKASLLLPAGTTVMPGASIVIVGDKATFTADIPMSYGLGSVFEFVKADYLLNSVASEVRIFGPGCATPYETAIIPSKTYAVGQPWAYPSPSATCPASARLTTGGALGAAWKEVPLSTTPYGSYGGEAAMTNLYGSPTKPNNVACP